MNGPAGTRRPRRDASRPKTDAATAAVVEKLNRAGLTVVAPLKGASARGQQAWSAMSVSPTVRATAALFGLYLSYAVLRLQEIYPALAVTHLPMIMSGCIMLVVIGSMSVAGWHAIWKALPAVRWQAVIVALAVLTAPAGIWMYGSVMFAANQYSISVIVFISSVVLLRDRRSMSAALHVLLLSAAVVAGHTLSASAATWGDSARIGAGISLDPNDLAQLFVAMIPLALYIGQSGRAWNRMWIALAVALTIAIVPTQSRGGELGLAVVAIVLMSAGTSRWRRAVNIVGVLGCVAGFILVAHGSGADRMGNFSDYSGGEGRLAIWKRGIYWMLVRPWGYGINNFAIYFGWMNGDDRAAHNSFVQIGMELGVLGLVSFVLIWFFVVHGLLRQRTHAKSLIARLPAARMEATLATMMIASSVGTMVSGFFLAKAYASITLFIQGLGCAVLLGYPYRDQLVDKPKAAAMSAGERRRRRTFS